ncbi:MAG: carbon-nitrogen hydrolase family protein [Thermoleophilaceae bacterium]|nr:carbon-nitrogen hydrolase family protein [Thermoleophilaceae bacterium]
MAPKLIAAAVQMNSQADKAANVARAHALVREAAGKGATLVALPEKFNLLGNTRDYFAGAESLDGPTITGLSELAAELKIDIIAGSIVEQIEGRDKLANTCVHIATDGAIRAVYRKIHMFDVEVDGQVYRESDHEDPGNEIVTTELAGGQLLGLTVCYDIRFPELYRILATRGALIETVPAAFTYKTGEAHWELLLRARAVENQLFVVAPNQSGNHDGDRRSYGNSMIVDPWGTVLARAGDEGEVVVAAELDFAAQSAIRDKLPSLANRVPGAYTW